MSFLCARRSGERALGTACAPLRMTRLAGAILLLASVGATHVLAQEGADPPERPRFQLSLRKAIEALPFTVHGFFETRGGTRLQKDPNISETASIGESRLQLELTKSVAIGDYRPEFRLKADFLYDAVTDDLTADVREAYVVFSPLEIADLKLGRQILTWGTGDLIFINDLFPKDWQSFFIGRDDEYLKAPSDAARLSLFFDAVNVDIAYTPRFRADNYITGERISYWSDMLGRRAGEANKVRDEEPDDWIDDDEIAVRVYRNISGYELALYGYHGYWRTPAGMNPLTGRATFPDLDVVGASIRGNVGKGIGNAEVGYYNSRDDSRGASPFVRNSFFRPLVGSELVVPRHHTAGVQYYIEWMMDHDRYRRTLPAGVHARDRVRHLVTLRLTRLLMNQNLELSLFTFYSPSDSDAYLRPKARYKIDDHWSAEVGANLFLGARAHTFFGMFERNTNAYLGVRYSF